MSPVITPYSGEAPLELLGRCRGYYDCPKDSNNKRLGPLAGYAGKYGPEDAKLQYVGDVYANFAKAERHGPVLSHFAELLKYDERLFTDGFTGFIGAPEGGKALAVLLAVITGSQYIFPEKKVTAVATASSREESVMVFDRHEPEPGTLWYIVEDVVNNMSTPDKIDELTQQYKARLAGIICFLNRSAYDDVYTLKSGQKLPIVSIERKKIEQYRQDDPAVASDIKAGNVVWKPKNEWHKFEAAMAQARS